MGRHPGTSVAALASLGAGAIHGGAIGIHAEHPQLARVFLILALLQLAWGVAALVQPRRWILPVGVLVNGGAVVGWLATRLMGITWIDGLEIRESPQLADTLCAGLGAVAATAALGALLVGVREVAAPRLAAPAFAVALLTVPAMWTTTSHSHGSHSEAATGTSDGHAHDHSSSATAADQSTGATSGESAEGATVTTDHAHDTVIVTDDGRVWPWAYDPEVGIDVAGVPGVSAEQEARAVDLIERTIAELPRWSDPATATAGGWVSIGDGATGYEHFVNRALIVDGKFLDPTAPESLVYEVDPSGGKRLVSAMFMANLGVAIDDPTLTDYAGPLMQWHKHDNLCFRNNAAGVSQVVGVLDANGNCPAGSTLGGVGIAMVHVWIVAHPCGPFAALEGEGAGRAAVSDAERVDMCASHDHGTSTGSTGSTGSSVTTTPSATTPATAPPTTVGPVKDDGSPTVELAGTPGVTAEEETRAEDLVFRTRTVLPKFATTADAEAAGFSTIGDAGTGYEHYINWTYINDEHELDPDYPESLVYQVDGSGQKKLVSAMYMVGDSYTLDNVPNIGGPLTQWHIHNNLCFSRDPMVFGSTRVVGVTSENGPCSFGIKLTANPMIHVWIVPHKCGPFAALEGVGAGQIAAGQERLCDSAHSGH